MDAAQPKTQKRYSPEVRREMILDTTAELISSDGVTSLSMEGISDAAGISKSLIYKYFDSLTDLLRELLQRELQTLQRLEFEAAENAETFEGLVRNITHSYLHFIEERGLIIERLQSDPNISETHNPTGYGRKASVDYLGAIVSKHFNLPIDVAQAATEISFGLPAAAGEFLLKGEMSRQQVEELTVTMILGTITKVRDDYFTRQQTLKR